MALDQTIRPANVAVLLKLETTSGTDASPDPTVDAIPVESDSVTYNSPWTQEQSNEATGSLVTGAPMIIGQAATIGFRSRIKGAGVGGANGSETAGLAFGSVAGGVAGAGVAGAGVDGSVGGVAGAAGVAGAFGQDFSP